MAQPQWSSNFGLGPMAAPGMQVTGAAMQYTATTDAPDQKLTELEQRIRTGLEEIVQSAADLSTRDPLTRTMESAKEIYKWLEEEIFPDLKIYRRDLEDLEAQERELTAQLEALRAAKKDPTPTIQNVMLAFMGAAAAFPEVARQMAPLLPVLLNQAKQEHEENISRQEQILRQQLTTYGSLKRQVAQSLIGAESDAMRLSISTGRMLSNQEISKLRTIGNLYSSYSRGLIQFYNALRRRNIDERLALSQMLNRYYDILFDTLERVNTLPMDAAGMAQREALINSLLQMTDHLRSQPGMAGAIPNLREYKTALVTYRDFSAAVTEATYNLRNIQANQALVRTMVLRQQHHKLLAQNLAQNHAVTLDLLRAANREITDALASGRNEHALTVIAAQIPFLKNMEDSFRERVRTTRGEEQRVSNDMANAVRNHTRTALATGLSLYMRHYMGQTTQTQGPGGQVATVPGIPSAEEVYQMLISNRGSAPASRVIGALEAAGVRMDATQPPPEFIEIYNLARNMK